MEEEKFELFKKIGRELGYAVPEVFISLLSEKGGRKISEYKDRSHTWNRNFWNSNLWFMTGITLPATNFGAGYISFKTTGGTVPAIGVVGNALTCTGIVANNSYGIQVGTGSAAESFEGYALNTIVPHGNASGQLYYQAHSAIVQSYDSGAKKWTITIKRILNNNSGGTITVTESALTFFVSQVGGTYVMANRDLLGASVAVLNGGQLTAQYDLTLTLPN